MFQFYRDFSEDAMRLRDVEESRALNPSLQTFQEWLDRNKEQIPIPDAE